VAGLLDQIAGLADTPQKRAALAALVGELEKNPAHPPERFNRAVRNVAGGMAKAIGEGIAFPRKYMETYQPGSMAADNPAATEWAAGTAMNMVGAPALTGGVPGMGSGVNNLRGLGGAIPPQAGAEHVGIPNAGAQRVTAGETAYPHLDLSTNLYHGTARYFDRFRPGRVNDTTHNPHETPAVFLTDDPALASEYASSASKSRKEATDDIYYRNNRTPPTSERSTKENNEAAIRFLNEAADLLPSDYPGVNAVKHLIRRQHDLDPLEMEKTFGPQIAEAVKSKMDAAAGLGYDQLYKTGAQVYPVHGPKNLLEVDTKIWGGSFQGDLYDQMMARAKAQGYDGVKFKNVIDSPSGTGDPSTVVAVIDPTKIRSRFAAFDPANKDSGHLLGSLAALLGLPALANAPQLEQAQ
jgi:hypothetical protein